MKSLLCCFSPSPIPLLWTVAALVLHASFAVYVAVGNFILGSVPHLLHFPLKDHHPPGQGMVEIHLHRIVGHLYHPALHVVAFVVGHRQEISYLQHILIYLTVHFKHVFGNLHNSVLVKVAIAFLRFQCEMEGVAFFLALNLKLVLPCPLPLCP